MNSNRNGAPYQYQSYKSPHSYENYQFHPYVSKPLPELKKFPSFNTSLTSIQNNSSSSIQNIKTFPTATSLRNIPSEIVKNEEEEKLEIMRRVLKIAVEKKWSEDDVNTSWVKIVKLMKEGWKGTDKELERVLKKSTEGIKKERKWRSQERVRNIADNFGPFDNKNKENGKMFYPSLQKHHSLNTQHITPVKMLPKHRSKSAEMKQKNIPQQHRQSITHNKRQNQIRLAEQIQSILGSNERKLR